MRHVFHSARSRDGFRDKNGASGFAVVEKPFDLSKIVRTVSELAQP
jgi:hypothetical protein